ncbi:MAG: signal peptide peptidase SppA [Polyangiaceae bacterium]|nr:signal peptide peptidase SppA [Polyangiaceae bacterium]
MKHPSDKLHFVLPPFVVVLAAGLGVMACQGRPKTTSGAKTRPGFDAPAVVELDLAQGAPEIVSSGLFAAARGRAFADLVQTIDSAQKRETTKGFFVRLGTAGFGLSRAHEIGRLLNDIRKSKKPVVCHADDLGNGTLLLASVGCDRVWLSPAGSVNSIGLAADMMYGKRLLEKLHVDVDFLQVGKYKGAKEPFTNDGPSPEARESLEGTLRGMRSAWLGAIAEGRGNPELSSVVEDGPFSPEAAKEKGLIDAVGYVDEARDEAKKLSSAERVNVRFGSGPAGEPVSRGLVGVLRALAGPGAAGEPRIVVAVAAGAISMGAAPQSPLGGSDGISERELGKTITRLSEDESVKAVVLRIDSPGGSALASDLLWKKLMKLRDEKPLVVSIGGMAASGGYYLACAGSKIVAEPTSIVGSIGVVTGKLAVGKTLDEIGVSTETVAAAKDPEKAARATYMSPFTSWDDPTRQKVLASMNSIYDLFVRRISEGRGADVKKVSESAEGRIFSGVEAKERGMIDDLGGLSDSIALARKLASLPDDVPIDILGGPPGLFELLDVEADADARRNAAMKTARQTTMNVMLPDISGVAPPALTNFLHSMTPLLAGERMLVAMPFGLEVH